MFAKQVLDTFNELDYSIYNTVIRNGLRVSRLQIKQLADEAHVSTASVVRFCKKCGCSGFAEFKLRYRETLKQEKESPKVEKDHTLEDFLVYSTTPEFTASINSAFQYLQAATQIIVLGVGASGNLAGFGSRIFCNVGCFSLCIDDPFLPICNTATANPVVVAVSFSGKTEQTIGMAERFLENGCKLISITNAGNSPLAKISDVNIAYYVPEIPIGGPYNLGTEVPVIYIFERLARMLWEYRKKDAAQQEQPL